MTDHSDDTRGREAAELLSFYVNGTLDEAETSAVEAYLERSQDARAELAYLKRLRQGLGEMERENSPGELGLKRLQREIAAERESTASGRSASASAIHAQESARRGVSPWWRSLSVAACLALAVMAGLTFYRTGDVELAGAGAAGEAVLQVAFTPSVTEETMRAVLLDAGVTIVDGPSAMGIYRLALSKGAGRAAIDRALAALRASANVIEHVERD